MLPLKFLYCPMRTDRDHKALQHVLKLNYIVFIPDLNLNYIINHFYGVFMVKNRSNRKHLNS